MSTLTQKITTAQQGEQPIANIDSKNGGGKFRKFLASLALISVLAGGTQGVSAQTNAATPSNDGVQTEQVDATVIQPDIKIMEKLAVLNHEAVVFGQNNTNKVNEEAKSYTQVQNDDYMEIATRRNKVLDKIALYAKNYGDGKLLTSDIKGIKGAYFACKSMYDRTTNRYLKGNLEIDMKRIQLLLEACGQPVIEDNNGVALRPTATR